jgi:outer membrane protein assembly factor BamB
MLQTRRESIMAHTIRISIRSISVALFVYLLASVTLGQDWSQFRGGSMQAIYKGGSPVKSMSDRNLVWKVPIESGHSSPAVFQDRLYVTSANPQSSKVSTHCFSLSDGQRLWTVSESVSTWEKIHPFNSLATPTCCADSDGVVAYFGSYGLVRYSNQGQKIWEHRLPVTTVQYGVSTSPVMLGNRVFLLKDSKEGSFLKCFAAATGEEIWSVERPLNSANNSTPLAVKTREGKNLIAVNGTPVSHIYDADTGKEVAWNSGYPFEPISVPLMTEDAMIFSNRGTGSEGDRLTLPDFDFLRRKYPSEDELALDLAQVPATEQLLLRPEVEVGAPGRTIRLAFILRAFCDRNKDGRVDPGEYRVANEEFGNNLNKMASLPLGKSGQYADDDLRWSSTRGVPEMSNPVLVGSDILTLEDGGLYQFINLDDGKIRKKGRLESRGRYTSSPILWKDHLYLVSNAGDWTIAHTSGGELETIARGSFGERVFATPAPTPQGIIIRTEESLRLYR